MTFLDLLIVVVMVLATASLLAVCLMFLVRNRKVRQVCLWIAAGLSVYLGYVGFRINWPGFLGQVVFAGLMALLGIGAVVLERVVKDNDKAFLIARIMAAVSVIAGFGNALLW